jgi:hypothetical protein
MAAQAAVCVGCGAALAMASSGTALIRGAKPGKLTAIAVVTLVSGILNCMTGLMLILGCWTIIFSPLAMALGVMEILYAVKLLPEPVKTRQLSSVLPILQIVAILLCNPVSVTAGILSLVFANDPEV